MNIHLLTFMVGRRLYIEHWFSEDRVEAFYEIIEGRPIAVLLGLFYLITSQNKILIGWDAEIFVSFSVLAFSNTDHLQWCWEGNFRLRNL